MLNTRPVAVDVDGHRITVSADDGVPLAVRTYGRSDAPLTVVFVHGHCLQTDSWRELRSYLTRAWGTDTHMVFYDHRGHGESGEAPASTYTLDQLGCDLDAVIRAVVPVGPIVLVGHSMGAMTALVYARQHPETIGSRIVGVGLIASAASGLTSSGMGRYLRRPFVSALCGAVRWAPGVMHASKRMSRTVCEPIVRNAAFGTRKVSARTIAVAAAMLNDTSIVTMSSFLDSFIEFDESDVLPILGRIPALILGGSADVLVPFEHSIAIAAQLPGSELVCLEGAGHGVILERAAEVAHSVTGLVEKVRGAVIRKPSVELAAG
ncbi:alpha/beta fold hydrolase [Antrihabitans sp. YC2-6]|uniref:alpha/beta fold hydrolase n=1 Tax=Antrihabitans sp. YC2-6 TaxID=2799498 RepID=UPI0018F4EF3D|nr:alpha/beta hydrolase [Antrihabitans sp. YC2-6]MBJ8346562.1 alpha/beta hydrolase [Antrihabitans sp. YC2-6]